MNTWIFCKDALPEKERKALKDCSVYTKLQLNKNLLHPLSLLDGIYKDFFYYYCQRKKYDKVYQLYERYLDLFPNISCNMRDKILNRILFEIKCRRLTNITPKDIKECLKQYKEIWKLWSDIRKETWEKPKEKSDSQRAQSFILFDEKNSLGVYTDMRLLFYGRICLLHPNAEKFNEMGFYKAEWGNDKTRKDEIFLAKEGLPYFDKAIKTDKTYAPAYYNRARAYMICKKYKKAIKDYTTAIRLSPEQVCDYKLRKKKYMKYVYDMLDSKTQRKSYGKKHATTLSVKRTVHYIGNNILVKNRYNLPFLFHIPSVIDSKAKYYFCLGKYERALSFWKRTRTKHDDFSFQKAVCCYKLKKYRDALKYFKQYDTQHDGIKIANTSVNIALCYYKLGDTDLEKKFYLHALKSFKCEIFSGAGCPPDEYIKIPLTGKKIVKDGKSYIEPSKEDIQLNKKINKYFSNYYNYCLQNNEIFDINIFLKPLLTTYIDNAYYQRANAYFAIKDYAHALDDYKKAFCPDGIFPAALIPNYESTVKKYIDICEQALKKAKL